MIEVRLVTQFSQYEKAWGQLLPPLWEHAKANNLNCTNFEGKPEELERLDDGKYFIIKNYFCFLKKGLRLFIVVSNSKD